jgi:hypothetical protein
MRRALLIGLLALAGCGEGETERAAAPQPTVDPKLTTPGSGEPPLGEPARVRVDIPAGEIGVVGLDGRAGVRPERLAFAEDAELSRLTWNAWSAGGAEGQGNLRLLECAPNCAQGTPKIVGATIRLSGRKRCPEGEFFERATVSIPGDDPMSFIQAPC